MSPPVVRLSRAQADALIDHARRGQPEEVCGLVARNQAGQISAILPVKNIARFPQFAYHMEPHGQHRAFMEIDQRGWELAGIYHSHPATVAYPSETDRGLAFDPLTDQPLYPDTLYFIISLADAAQPRIRVFLLPDPRTIQECPLQIDP